MTPPPSRASAEDIYLGRQSIVDRGQNLTAFELLFRSSYGNQAAFEHGATASAMVIEHALNELGLASLLGGYRGFINLDADMLLCDSIELLPRDKVVLEILETVEPTPEIVARAHALRAMGFTLAMDDYARHDERLAPLLDAAHIVKVDLRALDETALRDTVRALGARDVTLLAEKVESAAEFERCKALGFALFQGYYFARPEIIAGRRLASSEAVLIRLLGLLIADAGTREIEAVFKLDPGLAVNMLRLVNSVAAGTSVRIHSLASALLVLGRRQVQRWLQLLLFARKPSGAKFPSPLLQLAATRGRFLELLATSATGEASVEDDAFLTGIMSLTDALLGMPLADIVKDLPVSPEVRAAVLEHRGKLGHMLLLAEALDCNDAAAVAALAPAYGLARVNRAHIEALRWANSIGQSGL
jgi:EAL and modified HD-GYP domain-containing signal transduction protein